jgi:hypothetical protein
VGDFRRSAATAGLKFAATGADRRQKASPREKPKEVERPWMD